MTYAAVPTPMFVLESGALAEYRSSQAAVRRRCVACGSPLFFTFDDELDTIWIAVGSFDEPDRVSPQENHFVADRVCWTKLDEALPAWPSAPGR